MPHKPSDKREVLQLLRDKAEEMMGAAFNSTSTANNLEIQQLFHELQIYQLELEMQNDELNITSIELEHQKSRFASLFELAPIGYLVLNNRAVITDVNNTGSKMFGLRKHILTEKPLSGFVHADDIQAFFTFFRSMLNSDKEQNCQLRFFKLNRETFYAQLNGICINTHTIDPTCYLTITDITEKKKVELEHEEAKRRLDIALKASLTGIWEIDLATGLVILDNFSCLLLGINPERFDGSYQTLISRVDEHDRPVIDAALRSTMAYEKDFNAEFSICQPPGSCKYVSARGQIIVMQSNSRRFIGTITDITRKKQMELETQQLKESQQNRVTAAALLAEEKERKRISETLHDSVGQMLYAIKINLQQVKELKANPYMEQVTQLLDQTIRDVRNISFELAPSILADFGIEVALQEMAKRLSTPALTITTQIANIGKQLKIDTAINIYRIVQELVNNSIKHAAASKIMIELTRKAGHIYITVTDDGKGFPHDNPSASTVMGSGLSSIRNRLTLYKGSINIGSMPEKGTKVSITIKHIA